MAKRKLSVSSIYLFYRANPPFWFAIPLNDEPVKIVRIDKTPLAKNGFEIIHSDQINIPNFQSYGSTKYSVYQNDTIIVLKPHETKFFDTKGSNESEELLEAIGKAFASDFRNLTKNALIEKLSQPTNTAATINLLKAFKEYTFFDNVSAWLYNNITNTFTRIAGDVSAKNDFIHEDESEVLKIALTEANVIQYNVGNEYDLPDILPSYVKWANVLAIKTVSASEIPNVMTLVICLYSQYIEYHLRDSTKQLMQSVFQQNLANRYFDRLLRLTDLREHIRSFINLENPIPFLEELTKQICIKLSWESCSIFIESKNKVDLELVAKYPENQKLSDENKTYAINSPAMTSQVFRNNEMLWSYDIANDKRNSHLIDDTTETPPRDWIGIPISAPHRRPIGVLRVKNTALSSNDDDPHFSSLDIYILQVLSSEIASILYHSIIMSERKQLADQRAKELSELEDFLRTFRHEIRSPLSAVCAAPERLAMILRNENLVKPGFIPKKLIEYLSDFKATGNRLEIISKALTLSPEEIVKDIERHNLFKDCIAPVLAFAVPYASKKRRITVVDKDSLLVNVTCDAVSISMAFHVIIDNAIKYTDQNQTIDVYGEPTQGGGYQVVVVSRSRLFVIQDDEAPNIKNKYYRGSIAKRQKLEGSGIGLYLADKIMELNGGNLLLLRQNNPVIFALRFNN